jgi:hypothetical protein
MTRNRRSAKDAGAKFERAIADHFASVLDDERIDRRVTNGTKDRGDLSGLRAHGQRVVVECKDCAVLSLPAWTNEAHTEAGNDDALVGVVVHKRRGTAEPGRQWVTMTVDDFAGLLVGQRCGHRIDVVT